MQNENTSFLSTGIVHQLRLDFDGVQVKLACSEILFSSVKRGSGFCNGKKKFNNMTANQSSLAFSFCKAKCPVPSCLLNN